MAQAFGDADRAIARHLGSCPICSQEVTRLRETAGQLRSAMAPEWAERADCLDELAVAAFVDGRTTIAGRAAAIDHLVSCARCRNAVASVARSSKEEARPNGLVAFAKRTGLSHWHVPVAAAAAAVLLLFAWGRVADQREPSHRAPPAAAQVPVPISPIGTVAEATVLRWASVAGSDRYRVTLFDSAGRVRYETELADTVAALPDSVPLAPRTLYLWRAEARTDWGRWSPSELVRFSIAGGAPP